MKTQTYKRARDGGALLVVLIVVMAITIVSIGFIGKSDVELACGENMTLRTEMDHLAESAIQHARGLILNPQDASAEYWTGATGLQLAGGSDDYYDVAITRGDANSTNRCNYTVTCSSYRSIGGEITGRSRLGAKVRLDPCIALWTGADNTAWTGTTVNGDVLCDGVLTNNGVINGDVFGDALIGSGSTSGQRKAVTQLSLQWPSLNAGNFGPVYYINSTVYPARILSPGTYTNLNWGPSSGNPAGVCYCNGDLELREKMQIEGMLVVNGNLTITDDLNVITAVKNFPALLVEGDVSIERDHSELEINGLAIVKGRLHVNLDADDLTVTGGLFVGDTVVKTTTDSSGNFNHGVPYNNPTWDAGSGKIDRTADFDGVNDYISVPNSSGLQFTNQLTISAWIKGDSWGFFGSVDAIVRKGRYNPNNYQLAIADRRVALMLDDGDAGGIRGDTVLETGRWYHVAATWNGSVVKIYVDSLLDNGSTDSRGGSIPTDTEPLYIGGRPGGDLFDGRIDDIQIYNWCLNQTDIDGIKDGNTVAGLVAHWKLDEKNNGGGVTVTTFPDKAAIQVWPTPGNRTRWSPAAGAFFKAVARQ